MQYVKNFFYRNRWLLTITGLLLIPALFLIKIAREQQQRNMLEDHSKQEIDVYIPIPAQKAFTDEVAIEVVEVVSEPTIKGVSSGIYHVPESPHYMRIKNVVQWFHSIEEAEIAGYRAPKQ